MPTPVSTYQPSIALNQEVVENGTFPSRGDPTVDPGGIPLASIRTFAGIADNSPFNAQLAQGQTLSISQQTALFALLGTSYGGNGSSTFDLPELAGTAIVGAGSTLSPNVGDQNGQVSVTLNSANMPTSVGGSDLPIQHRSAVACSQLHY